LSSSAGGAIAAPMTAPVLSLTGLSLRFGETPLFSALDLAIAPGERWALVGRNGCGKSTLLKVMAGQIEPDSGQRVIQAGARVAYLAQEPDLSPYATLLDAVVAGLPETMAGEEYRAEALLAAVALDPQRSPAGLSGGEARRVAIAQALVGEPEILLLDEPTNHLDLPTIAWLESELAGYRGALVLISHDRAVLNRLCTGVLWIDRGQCRRMDKGFAHFEDWRDGIWEREAVEQHKLDKLIAQETEWAKRGIPARRKRNQGRLRALADLRSNRAGQIARQGVAKLEVEAGAMSGKLVIEAEAIGKDYGDRTIIRSFSTRILRGDSVGLVGANGAGKTTLLRMLTGDLAVDRGTVKLGTNLTPVYLDQHRGALNPDLTLWQTLTDSDIGGGGDQILVQGKPKHVVAYLRDFLFDDKQMRQPVSALSGGERNRLLLAKALAKPSNLLILDEPTNDLDIETLDLLEDMLADYEGTLLLVSHDRDFLDRVVTSTILVDGGEAVEYAGGYTDAMRQRAAIQAANGTAAGSVSTGGNKGRSGDKGANAPASGGKSRVKLSYKDQRELEELPGRISKLQDEIAALEKTLADPGLFARDATAVTTATARLGAAQAAVAAAEERWLALEMRREELASG
jgi:ABC transport system ATP-binding/permease protein